MMEAATLILALAAFALAAGLWIDKWWQRRQVKKTLVEAMRTAIAQRAEMQRQETSIVHSAPSWRTYPKGTN